MYSASLSQDIFNKILTTPFHLRALLSEARGGAVG
jgi:hypothetical protein